MITILPNYTDVTFQEFISVFSEQPIRLPRGIPESNYSYNWHLLEVPVLQNSKYPANSCWFNCLEHSLEYSGSIVYGWSIWQRSPSHFVAQHHAVWCTPENDLLDITPNEVSNKVLFIPDNCAPFDFHGLKCPFNFEWKGPGTQIWFASDGVVSKDFSIAVLEPTESEAQRIDKIRQLALINNLV